MTMEYLTKKIFVPVQEKTQERKEREWNQKNLFVLERLNLENLLDMIIYKASPLSI